MGVGSLTSVDSGDCYAKTSRKSLVSIKAKIHLVGGSVSSQSGSQCFFIFAFEKDLLLEAIAPVGLSKDGTRIEFQSLWHRSVQDDGVQGALELRSRIEHASPDFRNDAEVPASLADQRIGTDKQIGANALVPEAEVFVRHKSARASYGFQCHQRPLAYGTVRNVSIRSSPLSFVKRVVFPSLGGLGLATDQNKADHSRDAHEYLKPAQHKPHRGGPKQEPRALLPLHETVGGGEERGDGGGIAHGEGGVGCGANVQYPMSSAQSMTNDECPMASCCERRATWALGIGNSLVIASLNIGHSTQTPSSPQEPINREQ